MRIDDVASNIWQGVLMTMHAISSRPFLEGRALGGQTELRDLLDRSHLLTPGTDWSLGDRLLRQRPGTHEQRFYATLM